MPPNSDDLERALRENLKLRHELAANVAKAEGGGIAYRLGWVLYWTAIALTGLYVAYWLVVLRDASWAAIFSDLSDWSTVLAVILPAFALYGVGRAFRYVLSGE